MPSLGSRADRTLTPKEQRFVQEYAIDLNGTQAAILAWFSQKTAAVIAYEYLRKPHIKAYIEERKAALMAARKMTVEKWVDLVTKLDFYDPRKLFDKFGNPTEIPELNRLVCPHCAWLVQWLVRFSCV